MKVKKQKKEMVRGRLGGNGRYVASFKNSKKLSILKLKKQHNWQQKLSKKLTFERFTF
jgi:hypothetical protein